MTPSLPSEAAFLMPLVGTWRGRGRGDYPTIDAFEYEEEVVFGQVGKPFLVYRQRTWDDAGGPLHAEAGFLRAVGPGQVEWVIAQPTGIAEVHAGRLEGGRLELQPIGLLGTPTAVDVAEVRRVVELQDGYLTYTVDMAAVGQPMQFHLKARLDRID